MTAPTVEAVIQELMDLAWNVVYILLDERGLLGDGLEVQEYTGIRSGVEDLTRYTVRAKPSEGRGAAESTHGTWTHLQIRSTTITR